MTFPGKKELEQHFGEELCKVANERFGYMMGLRLALEHLNIDPAGINLIVECCKKREISYAEFMIKYGSRQK
jgi:hypothetical protein